MSIRYALLSLWAREPLSGYDIKQQMNDRFGPFWKVGSNQVRKNCLKRKEKALSSCKASSSRPTARGLQIVRNYGSRPGNPHPVDARIGGAGEDPQRFFVKA